MGRLDWKRGRFDTDFETNEINQSLRGHQRSQIGDSVDYYRFAREISEMHNVYDEGHGAGRVFRPPVSLPVLHATHDEGPRDDEDIGFYFNDNIYITASYEQVRRTGLTYMEIEHDAYLKDRFEYDGRIFKVTAVRVVGQIQRRDTVVSIEGTMVKPDEMVNDPQFAAWSA